MVNILRVFEHIFVFVVIFDLAHVVEAIFRLPCVLTASKIFFEKGVLPVKLKKCCLTGVTHISEKNLDAVCS